MQIYRLTINDLDFQRFYDVYIIIGQTKEGFWIGISTKIDYQRDLSEDRHPLPLLSGRQVKAISSCTQEIVSVVERVIQNFAFPTIAPYYFDFEIISPSYPFNNFVWEIASAKSEVIEQLLESIAFLQSRSLNSDEDWYSLGYIYPDEKGEYEITEDFQRTTALFNLVKSCLKEQRAYRFGLCEIDLYIVGVTHDNDRVCVSSVIVET